MIVELGRAETRRAWVLEAGSRYFGGRSASIDSLPFANSDMEDAPAGSWERVALPPWATDLGVNGALLVDTASLRPSSERAPWERCDWLQAAWLYLSGAFERRHEAEHGPVHSFAFRLGAMPDELYQYAWANRIFLFLRRWAARQAQQSEEALFGPLPEAQVLLTHDVDAITLTREIRLKQLAFQVFKASRAAIRGHLNRAVKMAGEGARFAFHRGDLRTLALVRSLEEAAGLRSRLHFYAGPAGLKRSSPRAILIDPSYDIACTYFCQEISRFLEGGWQIGLHQSSGAWRQTDKMHSEKRRLEGVTEAAVSSCRQHWLRFSVTDTWAAQEAAGLLEDTTLGFNDRPGFRHGHALRLKPWDSVRGTPLGLLSCTPMLFMDSHFYDYRPMQPAERWASMKTWLDEVRFVRGQVSVNWHTHTITPAYGWRQGFEELLSFLA